ncbi:AraC family transcriptional regulator [Paenibacillus spongiae]|uniref:AraC family transcriptional regulator n=1 Tax=Paenibacillus spongiae TaxID=2909671 RepID=A0ABY5S6L2_9BACL|nr:AraC family transcriptional regulator [Paenibacillus spongiae]UVI29359.1 AraC family transcriptional regulator [Paenibacillus spongiae]
MTKVMLLNAVPCLYRTIVHTPSEMARAFLLFILYLGCFKHRPVHRVHRTFYPYSICFVIRGKGYAVWRGKTYSVGPNQLLFLDMTEEPECYAEADDPWDIIWISFGGMQAVNYYKLLDCADNPVLRVRNERLTKQLIEELFALFIHYPPGYELAASSLLTRVLTEAAIAQTEEGVIQSPQEPYAYPDNIQQAIRYIVEHYQSPIKIRDLANLVYLSPSYFSSVFKRYTGYTVAEYIIHFRLQVAKDLLTRTDCSLGEIAQSAGFCSQSYFSQVFRQLEGTTPRDYRRSKRLEPFLQGSGFVSRSVSGSTVLH